VLSKVTLYLPAEKNVCPFQEYGSWLVQIVIVEDELRTGFTVISITSGATHWPTIEIGVNVYVFVPGESVLIIAGFQVPVIPLFEVVGNIGAVVFWHKGPIAVKVGTICVVTYISIVVFVPHWFAVGVKT
jgi:hypothetical protein